MDVCTVCPLRPILYLGTSAETDMPLLCEPGDNKITLAPNDEAFDEGDPDVGCWCGEPDDTMLEDPTCGLGYGNLFGRSGLVDTSCVCW